LAKVLVIDNYDSFTYNLVQMFRRLSSEVSVFRSDKITVEEIAYLNPEFIVISPGPKDPAYAGISIQLVKECAGSIPILGVCLGMQCINEAFGGKTVSAPVPMHGKTTMVEHDEKSIFAGIPNPFTAALYHSLMVDVKSEDLIVTAQSSDGVIMGLSHKSWPLYGVQFHPESFLTQFGSEIILKFLELG